MSEPRIVTLRPMTVAVLHMTGAYAQIPEGYKRLYEWIAAHGLRPRGMPAAVYLTMPSEVPESEAVWELWAPIGAPSEEIAADDSGIEIRRQPAHQALSMIHIGPYETIAPTYDIMMRWLADHGYRMDGPPMERYYSDPEKVPPEKYRTEVLLPVSGTGSGSVKTARTGALTKTLAIFGTIAVWLPVLAPFLMTRWAALGSGHFNFDWLIPAELFPLALLGGVILLWAAIRAHARRGLVGWGLGIAVGMLAFTSVYAQVSGLASGETELLGFPAVLLIGSIAVYAAAVAEMGVAGVLLLKEVFSGKPESE